MQNRRHPWKEKRRESRKSYFHRQAPKVDRQYEHRAKRHATTQAIRNLCIDKLDPDTVIFTIVNTERHGATWNWW